MIIFKGFGHLFNFKLNSSNFAYACFKCLSLIRHGLTVTAVVVIE